MGKGSAKLRKKRDKYYARFYDGQKEPKRKTIALYTTRKTVAQKKLRHMEEGWAEGTFDPWAGGWLTENLTVDEAVVRFLDAKEQEGLQDSSLDSYRYKLGALTDQLPDDITVRHVTGAHLRPYIHEAEISNATHRSRYRHIRAFFSWVVDRDLADESPIEDVKQPRKKTKKQAFLQPDDIVKLLRAIDAHRKMHEGKPGPTPRDTWLKEMIRVAVGTGLRRGELLNLQWADVDLNREELMVRHRKDFSPKNGQERVVPLRGDALDALQTMKKKRQPIPGDPVFIDANDDLPKPDRVTKRFKFYVRKAKLEDREELSFHSCRHTTGSWLSMQGVPLRVISEILGHSSTQVTEKYSHLQPEVMERAMDETFGRE